MKKRYSVSSIERRSNLRRQNGAAVILLFVIVIIAFAATLIGGSEILRYCLYRQKAISAVEGAGLAAANDLSAVVVEDPNFGYIALSDYAPEGQALLAADGEPLPVHSINTIMGTARVDLLIARQLNNQEFIRLAQIDAANARSASRRLSDALKVALQDKSSGDAAKIPDTLPPGFVPRDRLGKKIEPAQRARKMISAYLHNCGLADKLQIESLKLSLGTLNSGGGTVTALPAPLALAEMQGRKQAGGCYVAFQNMPVGDQDFVFSAVGKQSSLVPVQDFTADQGKGAASIVKVEVTFKIAQPDAAAASKAASTFGAMKIASCSQPFSLADKSNAGTMVVAMPDGAPQSLRSLQDFLSDRHLNNERTNLYRSVRGDYPLDGNAQIVPVCDACGAAERPTVADIFARGIYDWIRTAACRPRIDSLAAAVGNRLVPTGNAASLYYLRINGRGEVEITNGRAMEFTNQVVQDCQDYALATAAIPSQNFVWSLAYRDQVRNISPATGGKHAGQMMALTKVDTVSGLDTNGMKGSNADSVGKVTRRSYEQGGLAVEFVISSPQLAGAI